jgi:hypothetical protein
MGLWGFLAIAVVAGTLAKVFESWSRSRRQGAGSKRLAELERRVTLLEEQRDPEGLEARVESLEAIVVSGEHTDQLAEEFAALEKAHARADE